MRRLTPFLVLILSLAFAGGATAKEVVAAKVCGKSECRETRDPKTLTVFTDGGAPTDPPARGGAWYSVRVTVKVDDGQRETFPMAVLPKAGLMRGGDGSGGYSWFHLTPASQRRYEALTQDLAPMPASKLTGIGPPKVRVDEVVLPPREPEPSGGGASPLPWIAAGLALLAVAAGLLRRRRGRGFPWARPSEG
jgi:hypothetical protein